MPDDELDKLREQTDRGSRLDTAAEERDLDEFRDSITEHLEEIDTGERQKTLSAWDGPLAAFVAALDDHPDVYASVTDRLGEELDVDVDAPRKSELLALTLRVGFREVADEELDALREAVRKEAVEGL
ncbi:MAG: hypothetical protein ACOCZD_00105 [Haloferacaceae archaeon]